MISGERFIFDLTQTQGSDGIKPSNMGGSPAGAGPAVAVAFFSADGFPPEITEDPGEAANITISGFPHTTGNPQQGLDSVHDSISTTITYTNAGDDKTFYITGGGTGAGITMPDGFWETLFRVVSNTTEGVRHITIQFAGYDPDNPSEWPGGNGGLTLPTPIITSAVIDVEGLVTVTWDSASATFDLETGYMVQARKDGGAWINIGSVPSLASKHPTYTITHQLGEDDYGDWEYQVKAYKYGT